MLTHSLPIDLTESTSINQLIEYVSVLIDKCDILTFQNGRLEARQLFQYATGFDRTWLIVNGMQSINCINSAKLNEFLSHIQSRLTGTPIAFITRRQAFWNLELLVNEFTLIPRQETEILVETTLSLPIPEKASVLDLGTGTGAIALSLAQEKPNWAVVGLDKIPEAVKLAEENALLNQLKVVFLQSHWFAALEEKPQTFDLIVSNPPYVEPDSEYLEQGDLRFEPNSALIASNNGFADLFHIIEHATKFMNNNAYLVLEHGNEQGVRVQEHMKKNGFIQVETRLDYNNLPRITLGCFKPK